MGIGLVIKRLRMEKGLSQRELSRLSGIAQASLSYLEDRDPKSSRYLPDLAKALGISPEDLVRLTELSVTSANNTPAANTSDIELVYIPEYHVEFSAGNGCEFTYATVEQGTPKAYNLGFFQAMRVNPAKCKRYKVSGDSMEPLLFDRDSILVYEEPAGTRIRDGFVYVVRYGDELKVKRVSRNLDGSVVLRSENRRYPDYTIPAEEVGQKFEILGRVIEKSGTGGLGG